MENMENLLELDMQELETLDAPGLWTGIREGAELSSWIAGGVAAGAAVYT